jgi:hypothetical protein
MLPKTLIIIMTTILTHEPSRLTICFLINWVHKQLGTGVMPEVSVQLDSATGCRGINLAELHFISYNPSAYSELIMSGCRVGQLVVHWPAAWQARVRISASSPRRFSLWATSNEKMERDLGKWSWTNVLYGCDYQCTSGFWPRMRTRALRCTLLSYPAP